MSDITLKLLLRNTLLGEYMGDEDYARHHFKEGKIRVDGSFWCSETGLNADLALYLPPVDYEIDAWEASRPAGQADRWNFLRIYCCPKEIKVGKEQHEFVAVLAFHNRTFFDRSNEILQIIDLEDEDPELNEEVANMQTDLDYIDVDVVWRKFFKILEKKFDAEQLPGDVK